MSQSHRVKRLVRPAADACAAPLDLTWRFLFRVSRGVWSRPDVRPWTPDAQQVCIIAPHPDDETLGAGGIAMLHREAGASVHVVVVTDGGASRSLGLDPTGVATQRRRELERAMEIVRPHRFTTLGYAERTGDTDDVRDRLEAHLADADLVYAPSCVDFHPDHLWVAQSVAAVVRTGQRVRSVELGVPLTPILVNCVADVEPVAREKAKAIRCYASQAGATRGVKRLQRYNQQLYGPRASEVFWELSAAAYRAAMQSCNWGWEESPFRGIRQRAFTDPLSYLVGGRTRAHLATRFYADAEISSS